MGKRASFGVWDGESGSAGSRTRARRAALYATAKIALGTAGAFGLALGGCGGKASGEEVAPGLDARAEDLSCAGPFELTLPPSLPGPTDTEFACCVDFVLASALESATANTAAEPDPAVDNCCRLIIAGVEVDFRRYAGAARTRTSCCHYGTGDPSSFSQMCAPWGPPVPPAIDWEAA